MATTLRYSTDPRTLTVIDTQTGERHQCMNLMDMMTVRSHLEVEHMEPIKVSERKGTRLRQIEERRQAGR